MKIRIQDNSVRFRLTLREVEALGREGSLSRQSEILGPGGVEAVFGYSIVVAREAATSRVTLEGSSLVLALCGADLETLLRPEEEGVYLRHEWVAPEGKVHRFMAFVEKDRPGSTCVKKEQWIYDAPPHGPVETRPIPARDKTCA